MKVGDLVAYHKGWCPWLGIVVKQIPGTNEMQVIHWLTITGDKYSALWPSKRSSHAKRELRLINSCNLLDIPLTPIP